MSVFIIHYIIMPEGNYVPYQHNAQGTRQVGTDVWVFEKIDLQTVVDSIYNKSVNMGADAIMDFEISPYEEEYLNIQNPVTVKGIEINGIAIKRGN